MSASGDFSGGFNSMTDALNTKKKNEMASSTQPNTPVASAPSTNQQSSPIQSMMGAIGGKGGDTEDGAIARKKKFLDSYTGDM